MEAGVRAGSGVILISKQSTLNSSSSSSGFLGFFAQWVTVMLGNTAVGLTVIGPAFPALVSSVIISWL